MSSCNRTVKCSDDADSTVTQSRAGETETNRAIYIGTFSKVLFPALRLGYLVVAPGSVDAFVAARALTGRPAPVLDQTVLADFIVEGYLARRLRRMRTLYAERRATLVQAIAKELGKLLEITSEPAGLHVIARLPKGVNDRAVARRAAARGVEAPALSQYAHALGTRQTRAGLCRAIAT